MNFILSTKPEDFIVPEHEFRSLAPRRLLNTDSHDRRVMLKVKLASLAAEARIIRREELKRHMGDIRCELHAHRTRDLRIEARAAHLAYGLLRGKPIEAMERNWSSPPAKPDLCGRVLRLVRKYGKPKLELPDWLRNGLSPEDRVKFLIP